MNVSGSFDDNGVSALASARPQETVFVGLTVAEGEAFNGKIRVEKSPNGVTWDLAVDETGAPLEFDGAGAEDDLEGAVAAAIVRNETAKREYYRVVASGHTASDPIVYEITGTTGDVLEVLLKDTQGRPVLGRRDDGGIKLYGPIAGDGEEGEIEFVGVPTLPAGPTLTEDEGVTLVAQGEGWAEYVKNQTIASADLIGTDAGQFGHAAGVVLVEDPAAGSIVELLSCLLINDRAVAAYTDGGNITVNRNGGAAVTGLVSAANSFGAATDTRSLFVPLAAAAEVLADAKGLNLVAAAAFTNPGTAAGVARVRTRYRVHTTGL